MKRPCYARPEHLNRLSPLAYRRAPDNFVVRTRQGLSGPVKFAESDRETAHYVGWLATC